MNRRSNDTLYLTKELVQKVLEHRPLKVWDFSNMFFPKFTNEKQFDCAFRFLSELEKKGVMSNTEARHLFESSNEQTLLMSHVMPKLEKFGLIESENNGSARKYSLRFGRKFTYLFRDLGLDWLVYYARQTNERNQLEGDKI